MKNNLIILLIGSLIIIFTGCKDYLDIVPNNNMTEKDLFASQELIEQVLIRAYSQATPNFQDPGQTIGLLYTDEIALPSNWEEGNSSRKQNATAMNWNGLSASNNNNYCYWLGSGYKAFSNVEDDRNISPWKAIRQCDFFLRHIDGVDEVIMDKNLAKIRKGEALFIKAWSYFLLLRQYGPIPLVKEYATPSSSINELQLERRPYDECVDFIDNILSQSINFLPSSVQANAELGRITKPVAYALRSRLMLYAASPLFNGNPLYAAVKNKNGEALFNSEYDEKKWKRAAIAADSAIFWAEATGVNLYRKGNPNELNYSLYPNPDFEKAKDSYRGVSMLPYEHNSEIIWGYSPSNHPWETSPIQSFCLIRNKTNKNRRGYACMGATLRMAELFYTENGLPIDQDNSFPYNERYTPVTITEKDKDKGQVDEITAQLNLQREPRFYGALAFDRGYYKCQGQSGNKIAFNGDVTLGFGFPLKMRFSEPHGQASLSDLYYSATGYIPKKRVHFESADDDIGSIQITVTPIFRLAELYLNKAEALNELNGPSQEVFNALNKIRERAFIPSIKEAWSSKYCKDPGRIESKEGVRSIIHHERNIEFAFEGHRTWDLRRWLKGDILNSYVYGWKVDENSTESYYTIHNIEQQKRLFVPSFYLFPIPYSEILKNKNLVQNYGY